MMGNIFDIQRFCVHDGPGIRTTVFVKGCPLRCIWCHNPESQKKELSIAYYENKCVLCGACVAACKQGCHSLIQTDGVTQNPPKHVFNREKCVKCGACAAACPSGALEALGRMASVDEILSEVERDKVFYKNSGGGLTVSGGEPLMQLEFLLELLKKAKEKGIHTCIETCGFATKEAIKSIVPYTDIFLFDIKETDSERHKAFTGVPFEPILENLRLIDSLGAKTVLRLPLIPEKNLRDGHLESVASLASTLNGVLEINVMAYHTLGSSKYEALDMKDEMKGSEAMSKELKTECIDKLTKYLAKLGKNIPVK